MPRDLDPATQAQTVANAANIGFFLEITFKSQTEYVSTLPCDYVWNGKTWKGTGSFGQIGQVTEGTDVQAYGTTVGLSGIDSALLSECLSDIQLGAPAILYLVFFDDQLNIIGTPAVVFGGQVDQPSTLASPETVTITLSLENEMVNLQRAQMRRLTSADQKIDFPDDISMDWVPQLNFMALKSGTS